jgi:hypothetical protein
VTAEQKRLYAKIKRGETVSTRGDWMTLDDLRLLGAIDVRRAPNGQLEYLHLGVPIKVGP